MEDAISILSEKTILIVGRRGRGKSSLSNLIRTGKHWQQDFPLSHGAGSVMGDPKHLRSVINSLTIIDTSGVDDTVSNVQAIKELQGIIELNDTIHGVLFVMRTGRCDEWDKVVYMMYLQFILSGVPNSMIGVVFTNAHHSFVKENRWEFYQSKNNAMEEKTFELFISEVLTRCENKVCFIDNPPPQEDLIDLDTVRNVSLLNVLKLISTFTGSFSFNTIFHTIYNCWVLWSEQIRQNKLSVGVSIVAFMLSVIGFLAKKYVSIQIKN